MGDLCFLTREHVYIFIFISFLHTQSRCFFFSKLARTERSHFLPLSLELDKSLSIGEFTGSSRVCSLDLVVGLAEESPGLNQCFFSAPVYLDFFPVNNFLATDRIRTPFPLMRGNHGLFTSSPSPPGHAVRASPSLMALGWQLTPVLFLGKNRLRVIFTWISYHWQFSSSLKQVC